MNEPLLVRLIEVVNAEIRLFHRLLDLLREEQRALVRDDLEAIHASLDAQQEVADEAKRLERERLHVVQEISQYLNMRPGNLTLARLVELLEGRRGEDLDQMRRTLLELNRKIRDTNANNAFLIRQSLRYTERCLDILTGQPGGRGMYGQFGKSRKNGSGRSVLNRTI